MDLSVVTGFFENIYFKLGETIAEIPLPQGLVFAPNWFHAGAIVLLLFLMVVLFGRMRHLYVGWSIKGLMPGIMFGFALALILEALFILAGRTVFTELLGWENPPKPIAVALDFGKEKVEKTLGASSSVPTLKASDVNTAESVMSVVVSMEEIEKQKLQRLFCKPN